MIRIVKPSIRTLGRHTSVPRSGCAMTDVPVRPCPQCHRPGLVFGVTAEGTALTLSVKCPSCNHRWTVGQELKPLSAAM